MSPRVRGAEYAGWSLAMASNIFAKYRWANLSDADARKWAALWSTTWRVALRTLGNPAKEALRRSIASGAHGLEVSLHDWFTALRPAAAFESEAMARAFEQLARSKLKLTVLNIRGKYPTVIVHRSPINPGGVEGLVPMPSFDVHRVPYISHTLKEYTGFEWRFEANALNQHELSNLMKSARLAAPSPAVQAGVKKIVEAPSTGPSAWKVAPHLPFRLPAFARVSHAFKAGRPVGWAAVGAEAVNLLNIVGFVSFLRGNNPGFIASVLWKNPVVAFPVGLAINLFLGRKRRRELRKKIRDLQAQAERDTMATIERLRVEAAAARKRQVRRQATRGWLLAKDLQALRYGSVPRQEVGR